MTSRWPPAKGKGQAGGVLPQAALQVNHLNQEFDLSSRPHVSSFWQSTYSASLCMDDATMQCYEFQCSHSQHASCRLSQSHTLALSAILAWVSLCNYTPPWSGCTSLCWYTHSVTKETQAQGRLAQLKLQLPWKRGLLELGYKTNKADKQATFGGDSVPCTPEIKNTL